MDLKQIKLWKKIAAIFLLAAFLFPLVYNPVHYLFVEHFHPTEKSTPGIDSFHKSCKLDDFNFVESSDLETISSECFKSIYHELELGDETRTTLSYHNFTFLLRAPPVFVLS